MNRHCTPPGAPNYVYYNANGPLELCKVEALIKLIAEFLTAVKDTGQQWGDVNLF